MENQRTVWEGSLGRSYEGGLSSRQDETRVLETSLADQEPERIQNRSFRACTEPAETQE